MNRVIRIATALVFLCTMSLFSQIWYSTGAVSVYVAGGCGGPDLPFSVGVCCRVSYGTTLPVASRYFHNGITEMSGAPIFAIGPTWPLTEERSTVRLFLQRSRNLLKCSQLNDSGPHLCLRELRHSE
jgi:hypothetical protein